MKRDLINFREELHQELGNILDYWITYAQDFEHSGFHGKIDHYNKISANSPKGAVLNARILWTFSAALDQTKNEAYIEPATKAFDYISDKFYDREYGGLIWEVSYQGKPSITKKQIYAQAFGIYGFSEFYKVLGNKESLDLAKELYRLIEEYSFDLVHGGYLECLSQDWKPIEDVRLSEKDQNFPKSMNTHLHVLEAYMNLYKVWKNELLKNQLRLLIRIFLDHIIDNKREHFHLFFAKDWTVKSNIISFGHDIEGAWLLTEAAVLLEDPILLEEVQLTAITIAEATIREGMDIDASLYYELDLARGHLDTNKHWWPQAEAMVGLMNAFEISKEEKYLIRCMDLWEFVKSKVIDRKYGEWYWSLDKSGKPNEQEEKVGFWKCPYHNSRACMEMIRRIDTFSK